VPAPPPAPAPTTPVLAAATQTIGAALQPFPAYNDVRATSPAQNSDNGDGHGNGQANGHDPGHGHSEHHGHGNHDENH
jgi:hypothetical protein